MKLVLAFLLSILGHALGKGTRGSDAKFENPYNIVHVIQTDFLQYQLDLVHLGKARLNLFETFTVPSIKKQSNQQFLWTIWTDPDLSDNFRNELKEAVKDVDNVVVIGYRRDKEVDFRDFNGLPEKEVSDAIVSGNKDMLLAYHKASQDRLLLETRLDADDALHKDFVESIQRQASVTIGKSDLNSDYRIFCPEHHTEWRYYKPQQKSSSEKKQGHLVHYHNPSFCINTGLTVGYQKKAKSRHLQTHQQCNMNQWYEECISGGYTGIRINKVVGTAYINHYCVSRVRMVKDDNAQAVLLSKTPTTAGMKRVMGTDKTYKATFESKSAQKDAWKMVDEIFGVEKEKVKELRDQMEDDITNILQDALEGQCMPGHSCKASTKRKLLKLLKKAKAKKEKKSKVKN